MAEDPYREDIHRDCRARIDGLCTELAQAKVKHRQPWSSDEWSEFALKTGTGLAALVLSSFFSWALYDCWSDNPGRCHIENYDGPLLHSDKKFKLVQDVPWSTETTPDITVGLFTTVDEAVEAGRKAGCPNYSKETK